MLCYGFESQLSVGTHVDNEGKFQPDVANKLDYNTAQNLRHQFQQNTVCV